MIGVSAPPPRLLSLAQGGPSRLLVCWKFTPSVFPLGLGAPEGQGVPVPGVHLFPIHASRYSNDSLLCTYRVQAVGGENTHKQEAPRAGGKTGSCSDLA